jgi:hypothetical protein
LAIQIQRGVTLSSSVAEYVAILEAINEIKFIHYLLQGIGIEIELPIIMKTDNIGSMIMAQNSSSGVRPYHVDTRYHYIQENMKDGFIKIGFVKEIYERHVKNVSEDCDGKYGN